MIESYIIILVACSVCESMIIIAENTGGGDIAIQYAFKSKWKLCFIISPKKLRPLEHFAL